MGDSEDETKSDHMAACLFMMDDNHFLVEWLAYHYTVLPLRRIIVTVDRNSRTSPREIFDRYQGLINITFLELEDFYTIETSKRDHYKVHEGNFTDGARELHRKTAFVNRQAPFLAQCMLRLQDEGYRWITGIDTDERIAIYNQYANEPLPRRHATLVKVLQDEENLKLKPVLNRTCILMPRYHFGPHEETNASLVSRDFPPELSDMDPLNFHTYRWRHRGTFKWESIPGKSIVDLSKTPRNWLHKSDPHKMVKSACGKHVRGSGELAPFIVHHYAGSWEEFTFRNDIRKMAKSQGAYNKLRKLYTQEEDDNARGWLRPFIDQVGLEKARFLLQGVGQLGNKTLTPIGHHLITFENERAT